MSCNSDFWKPRLRLYGYVVALPLLFLAIGVWQVGRGAESIGAYRAAQADLPRTLEHLQALLVRSPDATVRFEGRESVYTAADAIRMVKKGIVSVEHDVTVAGIRLTLAWVTIAAGTLALFAGIGGLVASSVVGYRARLSREHLINGFSLVRRLLPALLGVQAGCGAVACLAACLFELGALWFFGRVSAAEMKLVGVALVLAVGAVWAAVRALRQLRQAFALFAPEPLEVLGREVGEAEAPGLWTLVRTLAARQRALLPQHIVVGLTQGFFATSATVRLWPEERSLQGRTLYVPAPYLPLLGRDEITAIIGHELAHFSGGDTAYSLRFAPIYASMARSLQAMFIPSRAALLLRPSIMLGVHAMDTFEVAVGHWSRLREFEADRMGARLGGNMAAASALIRTSAAAPIVETVLQANADAPDRARGDLVAHVVEEAAVSGFPDPAAHLDDRQPHPTDTHPPTGQRIAALSVAVDHRLMGRATRAVQPEDEAFAADLFTDWAGLCRALSDDFLGGARRHKAALKTMLEQAVSAAPLEETALYENSRLAVWLRGAAAAIALGAAAVLGHAALAGEPTGGSGSLLAMALVACAAGAGMAAFAWATARRSRQPYLVLTPAGFRSAALRDLVDWANVNSYRVVTGSSLAVIFQLAPGAPLPARRRGSWKAAINDRVHSLTISAVGGARGLKPQEFADLIGRYLHAAHARALLESEAVRRKPWGGELESGG